MFVPGRIINFIKSPMERSTTSSLFLFDKWLENAACGRKRFQCDCGLDTMTTFVHMHNKDKYTVLAEVKCSFYKSYKIVYILVGLCRFQLIYLFQIA